MISEFFQPTYPPKLFLVFLFLDFHTSLCLKFQKKLFKSMYVCSSIGIGPNYWRIFIFQDTAPALDVDPIAHALKDEPVNRNKRLFFGAGHHAHHYGHGMLWNNIAS